MVMLNARSHKMGSTILNRLYVNAANELYNRGVWDTEDLRAFRRACGYLGIELELPAEHGRRPT